MEGEREGGKGRGRKGGEGRAAMKGGRREETQGGRGTAMGSLFFPSGAIVSLESPHGEPRLRL